ncbi:hypothetical protein [Streptomyces sp. NPDC058674]|uniref:hypothetical protein n=1 Tax=Streptomyces sp. NPDC058674 TaxID=3346592 RepID=UPI00365F5F86
MTQGTTGRALVAALLCAALAACGTKGAGHAAGPAPVPVLTPQKCALDTGPGGSPPSSDVPTEEQMGGYAGPPTDGETGGYAGPPTDGETGAYAGPPTDGETGAYAGPPTDGEMTDGAGPCGPADWFDTTGDFAAYFARHRTDSDSSMPADTIREVRVRKVRGVGEARISFVTEAPGKSRLDDAQRMAALFADWRREVFGDRGQVTARSTDGVSATARW